MPPIMIPKATIPLVNMSYSQLTLFTLCPVLLEVEHLNVGHCHTGSDGKGHYSIVLVTVGTSVTGILQSLSRGTNFLLLVSNKLTEGLTAEDLDRFVLNVVLETTDEVRLGTLVGIDTKLPA